MSSASQDSGRRRVNGRPAGRGQTERPRTRTTARSVDSRSAGSAGRPRTSGSRPPVRRRRRYRTWPLLLAGLITALLSALLLSLLYTLYCYLAARNGNVSVIAPTVIYFVVIFLGAWLIGWLNKGTSPKPALFLGLLFFCGSLGYSLAAFGLGQVKFSYLLIKLVISLAAAVLGYLGAALVHAASYNRKNRARRQRHEQRMQNRDELEE